MNAAAVVNMRENVTQTAPAAKGRFNSRSSFASCNRVFPKPVLMLVNTTDTKPVPNPVTPIASHTSHPLIPAARSFGVFCACALSMLGG